jgi:hypothetical protein
MLDQSRTNLFSQVVNAGPIGTSRENNLKLRDVSMLFQFRLPSVVALDNKF